MIRTNQWLYEQFEWLWNTAFSDVDRVNPIEVRFGPKSFTRFGSIRLSQGTSRILINGFFKDPQVPREVIIAVLAHELAHYAHGFSSLLPQKYRYPHKGGVVTQELYARQLGNFYEFEQKWRKSVWPNFAREHYVLRARKRTVRRVRRVSRSQPAVLLPKIIQNLLRKYLQPDSPNRRRV